MLCLDPINKFLVVGDGSDGDVDDGDVGGDGGNGGDGSEWWCVMVMMVMMVVMVMVRGKTVMVVVVTRRIERGGHGAGNFSLRR